MTDDALMADHWMLASRQLINWGSYEGYHVFRPSMDPGMPITLLAGASESGKSTLVDARTPCSTLPARHSTRLRIPGVPNAAITRICVV